MAIQDLEMINTSTPPGGDDYSKLVMIIQQLESHLVARFNRIEDGMAIIAEDSKKYSQSILKLEMKSVELEKGIDSIESSVKERETSCRASLDKKFDSLVATDDAIWKKVDGNATKTDTLENKMYELGGGLKTMNLLFVPIYLAVIVAIVLSALKLK
jgi:Zn-dependent M16 (insulinase) family peptidase